MGTTVVVDEKTNINFSSVTEQKLRCKLSDRIVLYADDSSEFIKVSQPSSEEGLMRIMTHFISLK